MQGVIQKLLLKLDPETAHAIAQRLINIRYAKCATSKIPQKSVQLFGLTFPNPVGLAAGWDKNGECIDALFRMGFGFVEVGTVTPKPQVGNPKPRLFRIPEKQALINRMGFNNNGIDALVAKLHARKKIGILGVNIGKNKDTLLENALDDYQICLQAVSPYADYIVVNISSPNTPGLRELQSKHYLADLLQGLQRLKKNVPLLVKTTVDLPPENYESFVETIINAGINGLVISNTTLNHSEYQAGGLSGQPLRVRTTEMIRKITEISEKKLPIIGVGGILSGQDALAHLAVGAQLVQIFTGFVYRGSKLIDEIVRRWPLV